MLEINDYLNIHRPDVFCMVETTLKEEIYINLQQEGYKLWRRDRKGKGGGRVLKMEQEDISVEGVKYGDGRERRKIVVTYVPPKTNMWKLE